MLQFPHLFYDMVHMKEVAEQCGFYDYSVFYQAFMKEYGISPRSFRTREKETYDFSIIRGLPYGSPLLCKFYA